MSFLWDSNILRYYTNTHPRLLVNLQRVPLQDVLLSVVVVAEQTYSSTASNAAAAIASQSNPK